MASLVGKDGDFSFGSGGGGGVMNRWRARVAYVTSNVTRFADSTNVRNRLGLLSITGSATGIPARDEAAMAPDADAMSAGGNSAVTLTASSTATACNWSFTGVFNGISLDVNKLGDQVLSFDFTNGDADDFAESWDETP